MPRVEVEEFQIDKLKNIVIKVIMNLFKNWRSDWGNFFIIVIPVITSIFYNNINAFKYNWAIWIVAVITFLIGWVQTNHQKDSIIEIRRKLYRAENERDHLRNDKESIPYEVIKSLYNHWKLGYQDRITIYRYDLEHFVPVGRYSQNRELKKRGREKYPKNEGYISECWHSGYFYIDSLPNFKDKDKEKEYIEKVAEESKMKKGELRNISMKSRTYFCKNLMDSNGLSIAIIVVESLKEKLPVDEKQLTEDINGFMGQVLTTTVEVNLPLGKGDENE